MPTLTKEELAKRAAWQREWHKKNPDYARKMNLRRYGLTPEEYDAMNEVQQGLCAICDQPERARYRTGEVKRLAVDHDHETNVVRALLCSNCNVMVGVANEDPLILLAAVQYLEGHQVN